MTGQRHPPDLETVRGGAQFLAALRLTKRRAGNPSFAAMHRRCGVPASTLADAVRVGRTTVPRWEVVRGFVLACGAGSADVALWEAAWQRAAAGADDPEPGPPGDIATPRQLPPEAAHLLGRQAVLNSMHGGDGPVLLVGAAGVGKTALAVHWAHRFVGRYPDGQLFVSLGGTVRPIAALRLLLAGLGVGEREVPATVDAATGLYRSMTFGRRLLIVLDDARDAAQVRPLLPGGPACTTIVTSRSRLSALVAHDGGVRLGVPPLTADDAVRLLALLLADARVEADPVAARRVASLCGHLPLALRIAATYLADRPHWSMADYARLLGSEERLSLLTLPGDEAAGLAAAFARSCTALPAVAMRIFRRLCASAPPCFGIDDAVGIAGLPRAEVSHQLEVLVDVHLVEPVGPDRYAITDLLRRYAAALPAPGGALTAPPPRRRTVRWPHPQGSRSTVAAWPLVAAA